MRDGVLLESLFIEDGDLALSTSVLSTVSLQPYAAVLVVIGFAVFVAGAILALSHLIGPKRRGPAKHAPYESGVPPVTDARRRFHVRFYIVAALFLLFDVEVVFLWPWAPVFYRAAVKGEAIELSNGVALGKGFLLAEMAVFMAILLVGYAYAWRKGVFRWD
jgi:NADH-quinone oxidoreductase subunit A